MNYKAELCGFALDRAIKAAEISGTKPDLARLLQDADTIVDYLYIAEKDIDSHLQTLLPLIRNSGDVEKMGNLILTLEHMKAEMEAGISH